MIDKDNPYYQCSNTDCGYTAAWEDCPDVEDVGQRFLAGEPFTDKQCFECGALAFPVTALELPELVKLVREKVTTLSENQKMELKSLLTLEIAGTASGAFEERVSDYFLAGILPLVKDEDDEWVAHILFYGLFIHHGILP